MLVDQKTLVDVVSFCPVRPGDAELRQKHAVLDGEEGPPDALLCSRHRCTVEISHSISIHPVGERRCWKRDQSSPRSFHPQRSDMWTPLSGRSPSRFPALETRWEIKATIIACSVYSWSVSEVTVRRDTAGVFYLVAWILLKVFFPSVCTSMQPR